MALSQIKTHMNGALAAKRGPVQIRGAKDLTFADLENIGIYGLSTMDSALTGPATSNGHINGYMLETWLPGTLRVATQIRNIDEITGITTIGRWEDEKISIRIAEPVAKAELYGDFSNIPLADYRSDIETRGVVRFEQGFQVGKLEDARQSAAGYQAAEEKRRAVSESLDIGRNHVGFYGFNSANANVYGLLNDPNLPAYISAATAWKSATYEQLVSEFNAMLTQLETQMGGKIPDGARLVLVLPTGYRSIFSVAQVNTGRTFREWLNDEVPNLRIVSTPEFLGANGGLDVAYIFIENAGISDDSDAQEASVIQAVPVRFQVLGSENRIKGYIEDAINATAGVFVLRPWAFARRTISA